MAKAKIELLVNKINIAALGKEELLLTLQNKK